MKTSREERLTQAFVLTVNDIRKTHDYLQKWVDEFSFEIFCADSLNREFATLEELSKFENPPKKSIKSLRLKGYSRDRKTSAWVALDTSSSRNIYISVEGDEDAVATINDSFENTLAAIKPWYALLARTDFTLVLSALVIVPAIIIVLSIGLGIVKLRSDPSFDFASGLQSFYKGVTFWLIPFILGFILNRIRYTTFPMGVFAIGQGAKRHKDKEIMRTVVIVGFFISLVSSIVATLLFMVWR
jgi:hypothetical protein